MSRLAAGRWLALGAMALAAAPAWAVDTPIYKCFDNHLSLVYTDLPCKDGEVVDIRAGSAYPAAVARLEHARDQLDQSAAERTRDERRAAEMRGMAWLPDDDGAAPQAAAEPFDYGYGYLPYPLFARTTGDGTRRMRWLALGTACTAFSRPVPRTRPERQRLTRSLGFLWVLSSAGICPASDSSRHKRSTMSMLSPDELEKLSAAESLFPSPIPVQSISSDEFMPGPGRASNARSKRASKMGARMAKRLGMSRRRFFRPRPAWRPPSWP